MEYLPFGETLVDEHLNSYNTPFKFNEGGALKKDLNGLFSERASLSHRQLDAETSNYYYGARYYTCIERSRNAPRISLWLSVDPIAVYDPVLETEFYGFNQHNGGELNSGNLNVYGYCYQNPVIYRP